MTVRCETNCDGRIAAGFKESMSSNGKMAHRRNLRDKTSPDTWRSARMATVRWCYRVLDIMRNTGHHQPPRCCEFFPASISEFWVSWCADCAVSLGDFHRVRDLLFAALALASVRMAYRYSHRTAPVNRVKGGERRASEMDRYCSPSVPRKANSTQGAFSFEDLTHSTTASGNEGRGGRIACPKCGANWFHPTGRARC